MQDYNVVQSEIIAADISMTNWHEEILNRINNDFARGYLTCHLEKAHEAKSTNTESFRRYFLSAIKAYIFS